MSEVKKVDKKSVFAMNDGLTALYKFMQYPSGASAEKQELRNRVSALLTLGELYFPVSSQLNDPFETSPAFRFPTGTQQERFESLKHAIRTIFAPKFGLSEAQIVEAENSARENLSSGSLDAGLSQFTATWIAKLRNHFPMCCLSSTRESTLMWSYYAAGHSGVCVHFDASDAFFSTAHKVHYSDKYPEVNPLSEAIPPEQLYEKILLTKSRVWSHEKEYRIINSPKDTHSGRTHLFDRYFEWKTHQLVILPPQLIAGVTVGAAMADQEIEEIARLCRDRLMPIPLYRARCHQDRFDLQFEPI